MMPSPAPIYALAACALLTIALTALMLQPHPLKKILALNVAGSAVFLLFVSIAYRGPGEQPDPIPHAMVLTGIVVGICGTAVALVLSGRIARQAGAEGGEDDAGAAGEQDPRSGEASRKDAP